MNSPVNLMKRHSSNTLPVTKPATTDHRDEK